MLNKQFRFIHKMKFLLFRGNEIYRPVYLTNFMYFLTSKIFNTPDAAFFFICFTKLIHNFIDN